MCQKLTALVQGIPAFPIFVSSPEKERARIGWNFKYKEQHLSYKIVASVCVHKKRSYKLYQLKQLLSVKYLSQDFYKFQWCFKQYHMFFYSLLRSIITGTKIQKEAGAINYVPMA